MDLGEGAFAVACGQRLKLIKRPAQLLLQRRIILNDQ
ncbi:MAG: hypothetical protein ACD_10C00265G0001 [uncultured bacterium]|nr:MAG: hypothetical protein ACD_10C00265G0001 [uncultured bacterium]